MGFLEKLGLQRIQKGHSGGSFNSRLIAGREYIDPKDKKSLLDAYRNWVYICANKNATAVSKQPLRFYVTSDNEKTKFLRPTKKIDNATERYLTANHYNSIRKAAVVEEVVEHQVIDLFKNPNSFLNQKDFFFLTQLFKELSGDSYWYKNLNAFKQPKELWNLYPNLTSIIPGKTDYVAGYIYTREDGEKIPIKPEEMVHFLFPNPNDKYYGASPVMAVAASYNIRENADNYENALFTNMGRLEGYFTTKESIRDADFKRLEKQIKKN
ncbi:MAG: phage portal protein, partial [Chloroflexota bacterium]|nr:phage portal protein [Chloroflexota bacterium]